MSEYIYKVSSHCCFSRHNYHRSKNSNSTDFARQYWTQEYRTILPSYVFIPYLDCLVQQLNDRFQGRTKDAIKGMYLIPSNLSDAVNKVEHIKRYYDNDLPNEDGLIQETKGNAQCVNNTTFGLWEKMIVQLRRLYCRIPVNAHATISVMLLP